MFGIKNVAITRKFAHFVINSNVGKVRNFFVCSYLSVKDFQELLDLRNYENGYRTQGVQ